MEAKAHQPRQKQATPRAGGLAGLSGAGFWALALVLIVALRVPYFTSPNFILDGDESILGLMAKHLSEGRELPVFVYGQAYGFSLLETLPAALGFRLFGSTPAVLTAAMLILFCIGLFFYERAFLHIAGSREWSRLLTLMLSALPVWIVWSTKARGGYLSAFVLLGAVLWLFARDRFGTWSALGGGALLGLLAHAQAFWLPGALPLCLLPMVRGRNARYLLPAAASALGVFVTLVVLGSRGHAYWNPTIFSGPQPAHLAWLPVYLHRLFSGFFYLGDIGRPPVLVSVVAWTMSAGFFFLLVFFGWALRRKREPRSGLMMLSLVGAISFVPFLRTVPPRYLLSVSVLTVVGGAFWLGRRHRSPHWVRQMALTILLAVFCLSALQMPRFRPVNPQTGSNLRSELHGLLGFLEGNGVEAVYSVNGLLQWQILFYGDERIPARYFSATDRYPAYPAEVDSTLAAGGRTALLVPIAVAGVLARSSLAGRMQPVGRDYFVILDPSRSLLEGLGFEFRRAQPSGG